MLSRWLLVPLDLILGGRLGGLFAVHDGFYAIRDTQRGRQQQRRFDQALDRVATLRDGNAERRRRDREDELLAQYDARFGGR